MISCPTFRFSKARCQRLFVGTGVIASANVHLDTIAPYLTVRVLQKGASVFGDALVANVKSFFAKLFS